MAISQLKHLKVGMVGTGHMAKVHARHWANITGAEITAICTKHPDSVIPAHDNCSIFSTLGEMFQSYPDLDIVDICTPTPSHLSLALDAIKSGKHVLLEKPVTRALEECDQLIAVASQSNSIVMVGHVVRFFPEYESANRQVKDGLVGIPAAIRMARLMGASRFGADDWYSDSTQSGGVVLDVMIHDFDWLLWTIGPVDRVFAKGVSVNGESTDYALVTLHHVGGALSHVTGSHTHSTGFRTTFEICGDAGMIDHDSARTASLSIAPHSSSDKNLSPMAGIDDPCYKELSHFVDCIQNKKKPMVTLQDARAALQVSLAALESIETGMPVTLV